MNKDIEKEMNIEFNKMQNQVLENMDNTMECIGKFFLKTENRFITVGEMGAIFIMMFWDSILMNLDLRFRDGWNEKKYGTKEQVLNTLRKHINDIVQADKIKGITNKDLN